MSNICYVFLLNSNTLSLNIHYKFFLFAHSVHIINNHHGKELLATANYNHRINLSTRNLLAPNFVLKVTNCSPNKCLIILHFRSPWTLISNLQLLFQSLILNQQWVHIFYNLWYSVIATGISSLVHILVYTTSVAYMLCGDLKEKKKEKIRKK